MNRTFRALVILIAVFACTQLARASDGTPDQEASLVQAWETIQKADPKTEVFEKVGERTYRFKTARFPYDGKILSMHLSINTYSNGFAEGVVEPLLEQPAYQLLAQYPSSYAQWVAGNRFFLSANDNVWRTQATYLPESAMPPPLTYQPVKNKSKGLDIWGTMLAIGLASALLVVFGLAIRYSLAQSRKLDADTALAQRAFAQSLLQDKPSFRERYLNQARNMVRPRFRFGRATLDSNATSRDELTQPIPLSSIQLYNLKVYRALREVAMPSGKDLRSPQRKLQLIAMLVLLVCGALLWYLTDAYYPALIIGFAIGVALSSWSAQERFRQLWPVLRLCLNWQRVEQLLRQAENKKTS